MSPDQGDSLKPAGKRPPRREGNDDYGSKRWIENQVIVIIKTAMRGRPSFIQASRTRRDGKVEPEAVIPAVPSNHSLALAGLMQLAKLKGYIVEKRQSLAGRIDLNKLSPADLKATLEATIDQLSPGERNRIMEIAAGNVEVIDEPDPAE